MVHVEFPNITTIAPKNMLSSNSNRELVKEKACGQPKDSIYTYSFWPTYLFNRSVGLMPFSIVRSPNGEVLRPKVGMFDIIWFVVAVSWYLLLAFVSYQDLKLPQDPKESFILKLGDHLLLIWGLLHGSLMIIMDMCNRFRLIDIAQKYGTFDKEVNIFHYP